MIAAILMPAHRRIAELEAALKPFAEYAVGLGHFSGPTSPFRMGFSSSVVGDRELTEEDFTRAAEAMNKETDR